MKLLIKRLWTEFGVVRTFIKNFTRKDPFTLVFNPRVRVLYCDGDRLAAYLIMLHRKKYSVLKNVFIYPEFRKRGVARQMIEGGLQTCKTPCYLICRPNLRSFYEKFGFELAQKVPPEIGFHIGFSVFRTTIFGGSMAIAMVYDPLKTEQRP